MFDIKFLLRRRKLNKLKVCTGLLYNSLIANKSDLTGKMIKENFILIMKIKPVLLEIGKGLREKKYIYCQRI